eukprot:2085730-Rhodomonas_salina.2
MTSGTGIESLLSWLLVAVLAVCRVPATTCQELTQGVVCSGVDADGGGCWELGHVCVLRRKQGRAL